MLSNDNGFRVELLRLWLLENRPLERVIEELAEKHPVAVRHTQIAEEHREEDQVEKALESYQNALNAAPKYIPAQLGMAEIYQETGRWLEAIEAYEKVLKIDAEEGESKSRALRSLIALGDAARKLDDLADAKERYQEVLKIDTDNLEAKERLAALAISQAMLLGSQKKWKIAGENLLEAQKYIPEEIRKRKGAKALTDQIQFKTIDELEETALPLEESLTELRAQLAKEDMTKAIELREREEYSAAILRLEHALDYNPALDEIQKEIQTTKEGDSKVATRSTQRGNAPSMPSAGEKRPTSCSAIWTLTPMIIAE